MTQESNIIKADEGKIFRRIEDGQLFGDTIYLGYMYYLNNEKLNTPIMATPEMFEEIDEPEDDFREEKGGDE